MAGFDGIWDSPVYSVKKFGFGVSDEKVLHLVAEFINLF